MKLPANKTKIVCTIGPSSREPAVLSELMLAGMDVARLNFSHGSHAEHRVNVDRIRAAADEMGRPVAILAVCRLLLDTVPFRPTSWVSFPR